MTNMFFHPGRLYIVLLFSYLINVLFVVGIIIFYITMCLYASGTSATILVVIVKTLVVVAW